MFKFSEQEVLDIAREAGEKIMEVYRGEFELNIQKKEDKTPVTKADLLAHKTIFRGLNSLHPSLPVISEEGTIPSYDIRKTYKQYWLVDPLDGTKEFIKRNGDFTVNIALIEAGKSVFGCVYAPVSGDLFWAIQGGGAFVKRGKEISELKANTFSLNDKKLKFACSRSYINQATLDYIADFEQAELLRRGSSIKMMMLAEGKADIYPRMGTTMEWDIAASQVILEEAGGSILQYSNNEAMNYNKEDLRNPDFIAYGKLI